jgi:hypothetical protein
MRDEIGVKVILRIGAWMGLWAAVHEYLGGCGLANIGSSQTSGRWKADG